MLQVSQDIPCHLWDQKVHYHVDKSLSPIHILRTYATLCNDMVFSAFFYGIDLLIRSTNRKLEDHPLSAIVHSVYPRY